MASSGFLRCGTAEGQGEGEGGLSRGGSPLEGAEKPGEGERWRRGRQGGPRKVEIFLHVTIDP